MTVRVESNSFSHQPRGQETRSFPSQRFRSPPCHKILVLIYLTFAGLHVSYRNVSAQDQTGPPPLRLPPVLVQLLSLIHI